MSPYPHFAALRGERLHDGNYVHILTSTWGHQYGVLMGCAVWENIPHHVLYVVQNGYVPLLPYCMYWGCIYIPILPYVIIPCP
jgi:hypothetical protein